MYGTDDLERSPPHLFLYLVRYSTRWWKRNNGSIGFKNQGALKFIQTKIYSHHETYSNKAELKLQRHEYAVQH